MATVTLKGNEVTLCGTPPAVGATIPAFDLVGNNLAPVTSADVLASAARIVLNIFPSVDTPTCAASVRRFNAEASAHDDVAVVCISADLPFAQARFCGAEGIDCCQTASSFRSSFGSDYGLAFATGPLAGLLARAVIIVDSSGTVLHSELVPEVADEPDYDAALAALA